MEARESGWEQVELEEEEGEHWKVGGGVQQEGEESDRVRKPGQDGQRRGGGEGEDEKEKVGKPHQFHRTRVCQFVSQDDPYNYRLDYLRQLVLLLEQKKQDNA